MVEITVQQEKIVEALETETPGLAVWPTGDDALVGITHIQSGRRVGGFFQGAADALEAARMLGEIGWDWCEPLYQPEHYMPEPFRVKAQEILNQWGV